VPEIDDDYLQLDDTLEPFCLVQMRKIVCWG